MRLSLRFLGPLLLFLGLAAYALVPFVDELNLKWFRRDLDGRSRLISSALQESLAPLVLRGDRQKIESLFSRVTLDERLLAVGFCDTQLRMKYRTHALPNEVGCREFVGKVGDRGEVLTLPKSSFHISSHLLEQAGKPLGYLILVHDMSYVTGRSNDTKRYIFILFLILAVTISGITLIIAHLSYRGWMTGIQALLKGEGRYGKTTRAYSPELKPILKDLRSLVRNLESDRKIRDENHLTWTPKTLKEILKTELAGEEIITVSNREPYLHVKGEDGEIEVQFPASGLVTALEPIMRACSGTWVAHGSGSADKEVVDAHDRVGVPPDKPSYQIRRVWLTQEEEDGYYFGFANEGLWPLCHIAHARPTFKSSDWAHYVKVNEKFAEAVVEESKTENPVILVQDYHFALLPRMIRAKLPRATIISFWHIPWPNPEAFGICPWREEILNGMLGSSVMGFHTRFHCNNFLDTVDRYLECRVDRELSTLSHQGDLTAVRSYPISIEWPPRWMENQKNINDCRAAARKEFGLNSHALIGVGVDRLDYTKGIPERLMAVERLLELHPEWIGKFHFIQVSSPSRSKIPYYQQFQREVIELTERINKKYEAQNYQPIILSLKHREPAAVFALFRAAEFCFVSSLHDGMNLVAKEFVSSRDDEHGVLILSQFTGAARELPEALLVNPYNIDQCAEAINSALNMPFREQRARMRNMRALIKEYNVFRWAGRMLADGAKIRQRERLIDGIGDWDLTSKQEKKNENSLFN